MTHGRLRILVATASLAAALFAWGPARAAVTISSGTVVSFDGTKIVYSLFIPDGATASTPAPVIFMTHGWGGSRSTSNTGTVQTLTDAGYAVLTWDSRGFGTSGGEANVDSQAFEVRDAQALIAFAATQPEILLDGPGDPRMGMLGGSYAGGIQLMLASADERVDAIAPDIAWNDLPYALRPGGVFKFGWDVLLYAAGFATGLTAGLPGETGAYAPEIHQAFAVGTALNTWTPALHDWFDARSPKHYINGSPGLRVPTLITQGTIDTLFNLNQAIANEAQIRANGAPTKMIFYCGGHSLQAGSACATTGAGDVITARILAWYETYLRGNAVDTGPAIEYQTQDGSFHGVSALPTSTAGVHAKARVLNTVVPTSGGLVWASPEILPEAQRFGITGLPAGAHVLGIPRATVTVSGIGVEASLFFKLLDIAPDGTLRVVDDQAAALKVTGLLREPRTIDLDLTAVAWAMEAGHRLALEVTATSLDHASTRTPFLANLVIDATIPYLVPAA